MRVAITPAHYPAATGSVASAPEPQRRTQRHAIVTNNGPIRGPLVPTDPSNLPVPPDCPSKPNQYKPHRTHLWRSTCAHVVAPMLRAYERYGTKRLRRHGFVSERVPVNGLQMHAMRAKGQGKLPPVVVIHGLSGSISSYHSLLLKLKRDFREVLAVDLPGHGSSVPYSAIAMETFIGATRTTLDTLIKQPSIVFGHSLGGFVAAHYASLSPQCVAGLVLAAPAGGPVAPSARCDMVRLFEVRTHRDAVTLVKRTFALPKKWMTQLLAAGTQVRFMNANMQAMVHSKLSLERLPRRLLRNMQPPTLLLWGEKEQLIPAHHLDYFRTNLPQGTEIKILKGVNHSSIAGMPVFTELEKFAKRHRVKHRLKYSFAPAAA